MVLWGSVAALGAVLIAFGAYLYPFLLEAIGPAAAIAPTLILQLFGMVVVIGAAVKLSAEIEDMRWHAARDKIVSDISRDLEEMLVYLGPLVTRADPGQQSLFSDYGYLVAGLRRTLDTPRLHDRLQYMNVAFTPEMAAFVANHVGLRDDLRDDLRLINTTQFVGFTDGTRLRTDGWRLSAITDDFRKAFADGEIMLIWFLNLGQMLEAILQTPTAGWRSNPDFERLRTQVQDIRSRCHAPVASLNNVQETQPQYADEPYYA